MTLKKRVLSERKRVFTKEYTVGPASQGGELSLHLRHQQSVLDLRFKSPLLHFQASQLPTQAPWKLAENDLRTWGSISLMEDQGMVALFLSVSLPLK